MPRISSHDSMTMQRRHSDVFQAKSHRKRRVRMEKFPVPPHPFPLTGKSRSWNVWTMRTSLCSNKNHCSDSKLWKTITWFRRISLSQVSAVIISHWISDLKLSQNPVFARCSHSFLIRAKGDVNKSGRWWDRRSWMSSRLNLACGWHGQESSRQSLRLLRDSMVTPNRLRYVRLQALELQFSKSPRKSLVGSGHIRCSSIVNYCISKFFLEQFWKFQQVNQVEPSHCRHSPIDSLINKTKKRHGTDKTHLRECTFSTVNLLELCCFVIRLKRSTCTTCKRSNSWWNGNAPKKMLKRFLTAQVEWSFAKQFWCWWWHEIQITDLLGIRNRVHCKILETSCCANERVATVNSGKEASNC